MEQEKRTKLLGLALGVIVAVFMLRSTVQSMIMGPVTAVQRKLQQAEQKNERLVAQDLELKRATAEISRWKATSLPPDMDTAQRLYREWIYDLAKQCNFAGAQFEVVPGGRKSQKGFEAVSIEIKNAEVKLEDLARFLYLFDQASLLHRISVMTIDSTGAQGKPSMKVKLTAEGMSIAGTPARNELFPRTTLTSKLSETATELTAAPSEEFAGEFPFVIRMDREYLQVESATETGWKVKRGFYDSSPAAHDESAIIELMPIHWDRQNFTMDRYNELIAASMFVIPATPKTYSPRLAGVSDQTIRKEQEAKFTARAENFDPALGQPVFALVDAAEGMSIDPATGAFSWKPAETVPTGKHTATVVMSQEGNSEAKLQSKVTVTIKSTNEAPKITVPPTAIVVLEREYTSTATATDEDGDASALKFSLGNGAPEGLKIDAKTGQIQWTPPRTFKPGKYDVEIKVTDAGEEPKSATGKFTLDVQDDNAAMTVFSGIFGKDDTLEAWFRNKGTNKTDKLKLGDKLVVSEINAEIIEIENRFITLKDESGLWKIKMGDTVRDRKTVEVSQTP